MARSRYDKYESTSDGVCECISQRISAFIFACERRSPKSVSRKTFLFFFLATLAIPPPPAQYLSWGLSYITAGKWIYFAPAPQNHVNEIMQ